MESTQITSIPTHFGETRVAKFGQGESALKRYEPISQTITYRNHTASPISVGWRNGLKFHLEPEYNPDNSNFICRVTITIGSDVKVDVDRLLSAVNEHSSAELRALREAYNVEVKVNSYRGATIILDYPLTLEQLQTYGGSVYFSELDIVLSLFSPEEMPAHPYSEEGRKSQIIAGSPVDHGGVGFGYAVEIVDNHARYGDRYLNIGGSVYKVKTKKDFERRDGVYIISNYAANGQLGKGGVRVTYCAFEKAQEDLGLYKSYDEALHLGDISQARKQELLTMEHEVARMKIEGQQQKQVHERELLTMSTELKRIEGENSRLEARTKLLEHDLSLERQRLKDYFDQKSYQRKDTSEVLRILPTILLGIGALLMGIKSLFAPSGSNA